LANIKTAQVIINPAAGQNEPILHAIYGEFSPAGIRWDAAITHGEGDATRYAQAALDAGVDTVVVYGGDGTVREVTRALAGTDVPLAILPGGTGNVFAVEMEIPRALRRAARLIASGDHEIASVDVGYAGEEPFVVALGTGALAGAMENAQREMKNALGVITYFITGLQQLANPVRSRYTITVDGETTVETGIACLVANGTNISISRMSVPRSTDVQDGLLDVVLFRGSDVPTILSLAADVVGIEGELPAMPRWQGKSVQIEADPPSRFTVDGDIIGETPLDIRVEPSVLKVIVPPRQVRGRPITGPLLKQ